jgi:endonuclease-3
MNIINIINQLQAYYSTGSYNNQPFKVLISTILSQRTRDENTSIASSILFAKYDTPAKLAVADQKEVEQLIKCVGFYKTKAKRIIDIARILVDKFNGNVPDKFDILITLPGVGRKTANCVLVYGFGTSAIPVDTHVHRISNRLGIIHTTSPEETEKALMDIVPEKYWVKLNELMVKFGKDICKPVSPACNICRLRYECKDYTKNKRSS